MKTIDSTWESNLADNQVGNETNYEKQTVEDKRSFFYQNWRQQVLKEQNRFYLILFSVGLLLATTLTYAILYLLRDWSFKAWNFQVPAQLSIFPGWFIFPIVIFLFVIWIKTYLEWYRFRREKDLHFANEESYNFNRVPNFVIEMYKRNYGRLIILRWWLGISVLLATILVAYFILAKTVQKATEFRFGEMKIIFQNEVKSDYIKEYIIIGVYLFVVTIVNLFAWINNSREISNLMALFEIRKVYSDSDLYTYKRRVHLFCFCLFFLPLFVIVSAWWLFRKIRRK